MLRGEFILELFLVELSAGFAELLDVENGHLVDSMRLFEGLVLVLFAWDCGG